MAFSWFAFIIESSRHSIEYIDFLGKNYEAMVLLTVVLGGTIILTSILGVVSIAQNTKSLIFGFQSVMILLILAQAVISIQGIFHVTSHEVKKLEGETLFYHLLLGWPGTEALVLFGELGLGRVAKVFQMLRDPWSGRLGRGQTPIFSPSSSIFFGRFQTPVAQRKAQMIVKICTARDAYQPSPLGTTNSFTNFTNSPLGTSYSFTNIARIVNTSVLIVLNVQF